MPKSILDLSGSDIARLSDSDLRQLVAFLSEAELRERALPLSALTAGGHQDAADGGIDVRVSLGVAHSIEGFVPRRSTGFQVKVPDIAAAGIENEMSPGGVFRESIAGLIVDEGAYVIVSSSASLTDTMLKARVAKMRSIVDAHGGQRLHVDFYDRERVATWVRDHAAATTWVRDRLNEPLFGWKPIGNWSRSNQGPTLEFLADESARILDPKDSKDPLCSMEEGIRRIRKVLSKAGGAVRLVGLSGTGKTRLAEALFDVSVSTDCLEPTLAIYADLGEGPTPDPRDVLRRLKEFGRRAIVVVDNCPPDTHRVLAGLCSEPGSYASLVTIEYDVTDDLPEDTSVFRLAPASDSLIEELIKRRCPDVSDVDRGHLARLSGGNARIALALAATIGRGENIGNLRDEEIFRRLFHQRQALDQDLLRAAEVCSLVYSFDGEELQGELAILAALADFSPTELYRQVAVLRERELVQSRGKWRAVLPQALALRMATQGLRRVPSAKVLETLISSGNRRLLQSFSRRLGLLHDSTEAQAIVSEWLSDTGMLSNLDSMDGIDLAMFANVAPVLPDVALNAIVRAYRSRGSNSDLADQIHHGKIVSLVGLVAYDPERFERAVDVLALIAESEQPGYRGTSARERISDLFQIYLSGTQAPLELRLQVTQRLLASPSAGTRESGRAALRGLLETGPFTSWSTFEFGARSRDFGIRPVGAAVSDWFRQVINLVASLSPESVGASIASQELAKVFRYLWTVLGLHDDLERATRMLGSRGFWREGWIAIRNAKKYDRERLAPDAMARLASLEQSLRPQALLDKAKAYILSEPWGDLDIADGDPEMEDTGWDRADRITEMLGQEIGEDLPTFRTLLPILTGPEARRATAFGRGLAKSRNHVEIWNDLLDNYAQGGNRQPHAIHGFLMGLEPNEAEVTLEKAVGDPILGPILPMLESGRPLSLATIGRMTRLLLEGIAPARTYRWIAFGRAADSIDTQTLADFVLRLARAGGYQEAIEILGMRLHSARSEGPAFDSALVQCGRSLLVMCEFNEPGNMGDHHLSELARHCLAGVDGVEVARTVSKNFVASTRTYVSATYQYGGFAAVLFEVQPRIALDEFLLGSSRDELRIGYRFLERADPIGKAPEDEVMGWADIDPDARYPLLASAIQTVIDVGGKAQWSSLVLRLLARAESRRAVVNELLGSLFPTAWSGSLAELLEGRRSLLQEFVVDSDEEISRAAKQRDAELKSAAEADRQSDRKRDSSFE